MKSIVIIVNLCNALPQHQIQRSWPDKINGQGIDAEDVIEVVAPDL